MTIQIKPELEALIEEDIRRGSYRSVDEYVERAVEMLHEEEALLAGERRLIDEKIERATGQFERGEGLSPEESRSLLAEQKRVWLAERNRQNHES